MVGKGKDRSLVVAVFATEPLQSVYPLGGLRLMAGIETVTGLMMIGWSASFTYLTMEKFWGLHGPRRE